MRRTDRIGPAMQAQSHEALLLWSRDVQCLPFHVNPDDVARFEQAQRDRDNARYPASWSWPVSEEVTARADAVRALPPTTSGTPPPPW